MDKVTKRKNTYDNVTTTAAFRDTNHNIYATAVLLLLALFIKETVQEGLPDSRAAS